MDKFFDLLDRIMTSDRSVTGRWLFILRAGAGITLIAKILSVCSAVSMLYSENGLIPTEVSQSIGSGYIPSLSSVYHLIAAYCTESVFLKVFFVTNLIFAVFLVLGFMTRFSALVCWLMQVIWTHGSLLTFFGFDCILLSLLFYALIFPCGRFYSLDRLIRPGRHSPDREMMAQYQAVMQAHLCIIYLATGLTKVRMGMWYDGSTMWQVVNQPLFAGILAPYARTLLSIWYLPHIIGWLMVIIEVTYPLLIWVRRINAVMLISILMLHTMIALVMGFWLFSFAMIVFNLAGFGQLIIAEKGQYPDAS